MKQSWEIKKLGDVCELMNGYAFQSKQYTDEGYFVMRIGNVQDGYIELNNPRYIKLKEEKQKKFILQSGDILISLTGNVGRVGAIQEEHLPAVLNQRVAKIAIKKEQRTDKEFLLYFLSSEYFISELIKAGRGAAQQNISTTDIESLEIPLPPLPVQQRIVTILDEAFAAIAKAKANAEQNLKNAKELFESYLQGVFENKGEGWEEKTLGEIAEVEYGYTDKSTEEGDYRYVRITDIDKNGELILEDKKYIKHSKEAEGFLIQNNDLLMARTGATFAKVLLFNGDEPSVFASYLIRIKFKEKIENALYWHFSKTKDYWEQANSLQSGAAQPHFNGAAVKQVVFAYPKSVKEQKALIEKFESLSIETKKLEAIYLTKINDLEELKKSVLQKAFSGELK